MYPRNGTVPDWPTTETATESYTVYRNPGNVNSIIAICACVGVLAVALTFAIVFYCFYRMEKVEQTRAQSMLEDVEYDPNTTAYAPLTSESAP